MSQTPNQNPAPRVPWVRNAIIWLLRITLRDWPLKLLALVIALALWTGLITQDPTLTRERVFRDVQVSINNAELLKRNGYIVVDDLEALLTGVDVTAQVPQMNFRQATASSYNVRVDLNRLAKRAGPQTLTILATGSSDYGTISSISPATITVNVEEYVTRGYIPVNVVTQGQAPEGYYAGDIACDPALITVSGPRSLVEQVQRVEVLLNLSDLPAREGTIVSALDFTLVDGEGNPVTSDMLEVTRESVLRERINVSITLYALREVDILSEQLYTGEPAEGYRVTDVYVTPSTITLAGAQSVVNSVNLLQTSGRVNINGATETRTATVKLARPVNLAYMSATEVTVTVVIAPETDTAITLDVPVTMAGVPQGWAAEADFPSATVRITGERAWLDSIAPDQLTLLCDVSGLAAGVHSVPLQCRIEGAQGHEYLIETEPQQLQVTLTVPQAAQ